MLQVIECSGSGWLVYKGCRTAAHPEILKKLKYLNKNFWKAIHIFITRIRMKSL